MKAVTSILLEFAARDMVSMASFSTSSSYASAAVPVPCQNVAVSGTKRSNIWRGSMLRTMPSRLSFMAARHVHFVDDD